MERLCLQPLSGHSGHFHRGMDLSLWTPSFGELSVPGRYLRLPHRLHLAMACRVFTSCFDFANAASLNYSSSPPTAQPFVHLMDSENPPQMIRLSFRCQSRRSRRTFVAANGDVSQRKVAPVEFWELGQILHFHSAGCVEAGCSSGPSPGKQHSQEFPVLKVFLIPKSSSRHRSPAWKRLVCFGTFLAEQS